MKISLINPPNPEKTGQFRPPINIAQLAAYIRIYGYDVNIHDFEAEGIIDVNTMAQTIMKEHPDVIGFSSLTPRFPVIIDTIRSCKKISKNIIAVVGGPHASGATKSIFYNDIVDYAIVGEGEDSFLELLDFLKDAKDVKNIKNIAYQDGDSIIINPVRPFIKNLDELPLPAWDLLPLELYKDTDFFIGKYMGVNCARGCAWDCNFCASNIIWKRKVRLRSAEKVVEELKILVNDYNISEFYFYDDTFTISQRRTLKICELIRKEGLSIRFFIGIRADTVHHNVMIALKEAGCFLCWLGVESGNEKILKECGKGLTKEQIVNASKILKKVGIPFIASYILGHPGDTHESIQETIDFAKKIDSDQAKFFIATAFPGTGIYELAVRKGLISNLEDIQTFSNYSSYQHVEVNLSSVSDEDIKNYQLSAYEEYDLRKRPISLKH